MKNADLPAMPNPVEIVYDVMHNDPAGYGKASFGLTKREMFAMEAMKSLLSNKSVFDYKDMNNDKFKRTVKKFSYEMAEIMLSEEL